MRGQLVVMVEEGDPLSRGKRESRICGGCYVPIYGTPLESDARVDPRVPRANSSHVTLGRAVVDKA
jgi:hypothetical protein